MAKMFYSLEEAAARLGKSPQQVQDMAARGQLDERIINDQPVYKREQVDLLSDDESGAAIPLADSQGADSISLADAEASRAGETTKERSGISIFEADDLDDSVDASAQTQITGSIGGVKMAGDANASGSGLIDLTRDSKDDTGVGPSILQDIGYRDDKEGTGEAPGMGAGADRGALFENAGVASDVGGTQVNTVMVMPELPIDQFSGAAAGLAIGMLIASGLGLVVVLLGMTGAAGGLMAMISSNLLIVVGALLAITVIAAVIGMVLGKR